MSFKQHGCVQFCCPSWISLPTCRMFWPREIWGRYAEQLADFQHQRHSKAAVQCLNHMITDALRSLGLDGADQTCVCTDAGDMGSAIVHTTQVPVIKCPCTQNLSAASAAHACQLLDLSRRAECGPPGCADMAPLVCVTGNESVPICAGMPPTACSTWSRCEITRTSGSAPSPRSWLLAPSPCATTTQRSLRVSQCSNRVRPELAMWETACLPARLRLLLLGLAPSFLPMPVSR